MFHRPTTAYIVEAVSSGQGDRKAISSTPWLPHPPSANAHLGGQGLAITRAARPILVSDQSRLTDSWLADVALAPAMVIDDLAL
jgi:hypothetical protein